MIRRSIALLFVAALAGCSSYHVRPAAPDAPSPLAAPPEGLGMICALRLHTAASLVPLVVHDDGVLVGATRGRGRFCWLAQPGRHDLKIESGDDVDRALGTSSIDDAPLVVEPGRRYFLHLGLGALYGTGSPEWVDDRTAERMIEDCPPVALQSSPSRDPLPSGAPVAALR